MSWRNWSDLRAPDFGALPDPSIAILPLGATEQHGPHLPTGTDTMQVMEVLDRAGGLAASDANVLVLPPLSITKSNEHDAVPGTLSLSVTTLLATLDDIAASVARAGIKRLVFLNGHGGNTAVLDIATREARAKHGLITAQGSWFGFAQMPDAPGLEHDIHGGRLETSAMLAIAPELVDMDAAANFRPASQDWAERYKTIGLTGQPMRPGWAIGDLQTSGACGDAASATAAEGELLLLTAAKGLLVFLAEFASFDPGTAAE